VSKSFYNFIDNEVSEIVSANLFKDERLISTPQQTAIKLSSGKEVLNFCANDYLGLANNDQIKKAASNSVVDDGFGMASVRFICGTNNLHRELEKKLSTFLGFEDTILYVACFDANGGLFEPLFTKEDAIISDALNHASIIDGIRLCKAQRYRYDHSDMVSLENCLKEAVKNAKQIMKKTKCDGVKLEGGKRIYETIKSLVKNKIPVMGHLGLLPQSDKTFKFKGKKKLERNNIIKDSQLLEKAGVFSIVLECVETSLAQLVTQNLKIPTIGIGASKYCDGQILVFDDLIGLNPISYKFVKKYGNIRNDISKAVSNYSKEVRKIKFPNKKNSF
jgi:ketopantoate hydroxymethyltransferase